MITAGSKFHRRYRLTYSAYPISVSAPNNQNRSPISIYYGNGCAGTAHWWWQWLQKKVHNLQRQQQLHSSYYFSNSFHTRTKHLHCSNMHIRSHITSLLSISTISSVDLWLRCSTTARIKVPNLPTYRRAAPANPSVSSLCQHDKEEDSELIYPSVHTDANSLQFQQMVKYGTILHRSHSSSSLE